MEIPAVLSACQISAPSKLETSVALRYVTKLHILEWPFIVPSTGCMSVMICQVNGLSGKGEMLTNRDVNKFVHMEHFWDPLFHLMKHGTKTLHVAFIFLFSVCIS